MEESQKVVKYGGLIVMASLSFYEHWTIIAQIMSFDSGNRFDGKRFRRS